MSTFESNQSRALDAFKACVKDELQGLLSGEIFSIEEQAPTSTIASLLDQSATSDLLISLRTQGLLYTAANRTRFVKDDAELKYEFSVQLRNSYKGSCQNTELNKLHRLVTAFETGVPVILPRYLCYARVKELSNSFILRDLVAVETIPLIKVIYSPSGIDLPNLRQKYTAKPKDVSVVLHREESKAYAGIRSGPDNSFLFLHRWMLDDYAVPYLYLDKRQEEKVAR